MEKMKMIPNVKRLYPVTEPVEAARMEPRVALAATFLLPAPTAA